MDACTLEALYNALPTNEADAKTARLIASDNGWYQAAVLDKLDELDRQLRRRERDGKLMQFTGMDSFERYWLDLDPHAAPKREAIKPGVKNAPPWVANRVDKNTSPRLVTLAEDNVTPAAPPVTEEPQHPFASVVKFRLPHWQDVLLKLPMSEEEALTAEEIAALFPGTGLTAVEVTNRIKSARRYVGAKVMSKPAKGEKCYRFWAEPFDVGSFPHINKNKGNRPTKGRTGAAPIDPCPTMEQAAAGMKRIADGLKAWSEKSVTESIPTATADDDMRIRLKPGVRQITVEYEDGTEMILRRKNGGEKLGFT